MALLGDLGSKVGGALGSGFGGVNVGGIGTGNFSIGGNFSLTDQKQAIGNRPVSDLKDLYKPADGVTTHMYPEDLDKTKYLMFEIQKRVRSVESVTETNADGSTSTNLRALNQKTNTHTTIVLPIPTQIQDNRGVGYDQQGLGIFAGMGAGEVGVGGLAEDAINAIKMLGGTAFQTGKAQLGNAVDNTGSVTGVAAAGAIALLAANYANKKFNTGITGSQLGLGGGIAAAIATAKGTAYQAGVAYNPRMSVQFNGVGFREFTFSYKLIARSPRESDQITNIVRTFQKFMLPKYFGGSQTGFIYPDEFFISFAQPLQKHMFKFLPCVLTNCQVQYNTEGQAFFEITSAPVSVDITLTFTETKIITQEQMDQWHSSQELIHGYDGFDKCGEFGCAAASMTESVDNNTAIGANKVNPAEAQSQPNVTPSSTAADGAVPAENASSIFGVEPGGA